MADLACAVTVLDTETVRVSWTGGDPGLLDRGLEIVFGPVGVRWDILACSLYNIFIFSYYVVQPIQNPLTSSVTLENILPFTPYQLVMRTTISSEARLQADTVYFTTSGGDIFWISQFLLDLSAFITDDEAALQRDLQIQESLLILFVLLLWVVVVGLFFQRWGNIRVPETLDFIF